MAGILDEIVASKRGELEVTRRRLTLADVETMARRQSPPKDFAAAMTGNHVRLIAEVKRASPSRGLICADFDAVRIAQTYAGNGAAAISILTETVYFRGSLDDLQNIGLALGDNRPPLLRKDFLFDPYQVLEARAYGADAILLIVAILTPNQLAEMILLARSQGMECLVEVHCEAELRVALESPARIIGINNRDLSTFAVDITTTRRLRKLHSR